MSSSVFYNLFEDASQPKSDQTKEVQRQFILDAVKRIEATQPGYHPVYGFQNEVPSSYRHDLLERDCDHVRRHFAGVKERRQVRILDVGCNNGYVTLRLAETFPNTIGLELNKDNRQLAELLATHANSAARFSSINIFDVLKTGEDDLEAVDAVCLFNVLHQVIFAYGMEMAKRLVAKLVSSVDVVFAELANREDYVSHGKDHLLPWSPDHIFSSCTDARITQLEDTPRPLYKIERQIARFGRISIRPNVIRFSDNPAVSRKYYASDTTVAKIHRFSKAVGPRFFHMEVDALLKMSGDKASPEILDWDSSENIGAVMMTAIRGSLLRDSLHRYVQDDSKVNLVGDLVRISLGSFKRVGFHNDVSPHNIIVSEDGSLSLIDFEQSMPTPLLDPFAVFLWTVFDILNSDVRSYQLKVYEGLRLSNGAVRTAPTNYPTFDRVPQALAPLLDDAKTADSWVGFLDKWATLRS